jgi:amino acid transporter
MALNTSCNDYSSSELRRKTSSAYQTRDKSQHQQPHEEKVQLKRRFGLMHGVGVVAGLVIGGGIYLSPRGVLMHAGSPGLSLVVWMIGGLLTLLGALTYAEIGVEIPESGALYAYMRRLYGPFGAFLFLWSYLFFVRVGANAIKCLMFGRYLLKPIFPDCPVPEVAIRLFATIAAC